MKKTILYISSFALILASMLVNTSASFGLQLWSQPNMLNKDINATINTDLGDGQTIGDPIRQGAYHAVKSEDGSYEVPGITNYETAITEHNTALNRILGIIKRIINWALGLLSLVALVYIIFNGFIILTAAGDDTKVKKGIKGIKNAAIAIAGIGLSWFIISFIFWVIRSVAG